MRDARNRRLVPAAEVERLSHHPQRHEAGDPLSARNRFPGVVRSVEVDGVMALVEIEAGPHRDHAAVTRDAVEELGLAPGVEATAAVKATSVMVSRGMRWLALVALRRRLAGCGDDDEEPARGATPQLVVSAAASLTDALTACSRTSRAPTSSSRSAARDELAAQIRQGVKPDVYAAANTRAARRAERARACSRSRSCSPPTSW